MLYTQDMLDKRFCDVEENGVGTSTIRQFLQESYTEFGMEFDKQVVESMTDEELTKEIEWLNHLWDC